MSRLLLLFILIGFNSPLFAQNLSGKWVGFFSNTNGLEEKNFPYEINISNGNYNQINATTITRFPNQTSATAIARGIFTPKILLLNLQETRFEQIHLETNMQGCLMNNYLTYQNSNGHETLQGTYVAKNAINGTDCGMGKVYLARDEMSLMSKNLINIENASLVTNEAFKNKTVSKTIKPTKKIRRQNESISVNKLLDNSNNINNPINNNNKELATNPHIINKVSSDLQGDTFHTHSLLQNENASAISKSVKTQNLVTPIAKHAQMIMPWVLIARENLLVKKIITHNKNVRFDLFDNGTIDNDTITIYDNKILMLDRNRLSYKAVHFEINFKDSIKEHEIIVVANNLGSVPPNTALMVYKDGKQTEEIFINTNFTQNARLIIQYQPPAN